jgi:cell division protein FtsZ
VNRVMEQVKRQCGHAQIIMGAAVDADLKSKLCVTVIAAKQEPRSTGASVRGEGKTAFTPAAKDMPAMRATRTTRSKTSKAVQGQLPLTIVSKGRFDKSEPTLHHGEDLDVPTFLRRGIALN